MSEPDGDVGTIAGTWHTHAPAVGALAADTMRLTPNDPDRPRVIGKAAAAMRQIDQHLDLRPIAGRMVYVMGGRSVTMELWKRKDAPFGVLAAAYQGADPIRVSSNPLRGVQDILAPYVESWGMG